MRESINVKRKMLFTKGNKVSSTCRAPRLIGVMRCSLGCVTLNHNVQNCPVKWPSWAVIKVNCPCSDCCWTLTVQGCKMYHRYSDYCNSPHFVLVCYLRHTHTHIKSQTWTVHLFGCILPAQVVMMPVCFLGCPEENRLDNPECFKREPGLMTY